MKFALLFLPALAFAQVEMSGPHGATRTIRITASRQPISVLRAVTREQPPEGAGLYAVRACNRSAAPVGIDPGDIEQALEAHTCAASGKPLMACGIALTTRPLAALALTRARNRGRSLLARAGELAGVAAPIVVGFAAAGILRLNGWQIGTVSGLGTGLRLLSDASRPEREDRLGLGDLGAWLSDSPRLVLDPGECGPRLLALGSYSRGQAATIVIDIE